MRPEAVPLISWPWRNRAYSLRVSRAHSYVRRTDPASATGTSQKIPRSRFASARDDTYLPASFRALFSAVREVGFDGSRYVASVSTSIARSRIVGRIAGRARVAN